MKVIIAGGRDFNNWPMLVEKCNYYFSRLGAADIEIVEGGARGSDAMGKRYAEVHGLAHTQFAADWDKHGKAAGPIRNREMGAYGDVLIAFWDWRSTGTADMINVMSELKKPYRIVHY